MLNSWSRTLMSVALGMKRVKILLLLIGLIIAYLNSRAQTKEEALRFTESMLEMKKKTIILQYLQLSEAEKSAFWPIYNRFNAEVQAYEIEYFQLVDRYSKGIDNLSDRILLNMSERFLQNDLELARLRKQYYKRFKKALSPAKAGEFMHLDQTFRTMVRLEMQKQPTPLDALDASLYTTHN